MIDMKATLAQQFTDAEFTIVEDLKCSLEPVALVVEALSRGDINLISAEAALQFCVVNLRKQQQSELAKTLAFQLYTHEFLTDAPSTSTSCAFFTAVQKVRLSSAAE